MGGFWVRPEVLASAGASVASTAAEAGGCASVLRSTLSALGAASGHSGVAAAAEDAAGRWRAAVQGWALGCDGFGASLVDAAAAYVQVDTTQVHGGLQP